MTTLRDNYIVVGFIKSVMEQNSLEDEKRHAFLYWRIIES